MAIIDHTRVNYIQPFKALTTNLDPRQTLLANFLLTSLQHCGVRWSCLPRTERTQADADVCASWSIINHAHFSFVQSGMEAEAAAMLDEMHVEVAEGRPKGDHLARY